MISKIQAYFRVRRGARLLDRKSVAWWWRVDPETVDVEDGYCCPLGQTYAGCTNGIPYMHGVRSLGMNKRYVDTISYGFDCRVGAIGLYNARWRKEIQKRRDRDMRARMDGPS